MYPVQPVLRDRKKSAFRLFLDLYSAQATFRGFVDFSVIGALALLFLHGSPKLPMQKVSQPSTVALDNSKSNPGLAMLAQPPDFGRNAVMAPRLSELGLREEIFDKVEGPLRAQLVAAWHLYRNKEPQKAIDVLAKADGSNRYVLFVKGMASIALTEDGAFRRGLDDLAQSSAKGEPKATAVLGVLKIAGVPGLTRDLEAGQKLLLKAAAAGDIDASRVVAEGFLSGWMGSVDASRAATYLKAGAAAGDAKSAFRLSELFIAGRGVARDEMEADRLLTLSAEQGHAEAAAMLGFRKLTPFLAGITDDPSPAIIWLERSAEKGQAQGMLLLGTYYVELGRRIGVVDYGKALDLFSRCVEQTANAECAFAYASALEQGFAGQRDREKIYSLYLLSSAKNNSPTLKSKLDELAKEMSPAEISAARGRAASMMSGNGNRAPNQ